MNVRAVRRARQVARRRTLELLAVRRAEAGLAGPPRYREAMRAGRGDRAAPSAEPPQRP